MKNRTNFYFTILIVVIMGAGGAWLITHIIYAGPSTTPFVGGEADYSQLQQQILKQ